MNMTHFAISGIQMHIGMHNNMEALRSRIGILMHLYPWTQMVLLSELAAHGPALHSAQPTDGPIEQEFREMARHFKIWLVAGSVFEQKETAPYTI